MEKKKICLIISAIVNKKNITELPEYLNSMMRIFSQNGGKPLGRYKTVEKIKDSQAPEMIAVISFEDTAIIKAMLDSDPYKSLSGLRERVFSDLKIVIGTELI